MAKQAVTWHFARHFLVRALFSLSSFRSSALALPEFPCDRICQFRTAIWLSVHPFQYRYASDHIGVDGGWMQVAAVRSKYGWLVAAVGRTQFSRVSCRNAIRGRLSWCSTLNQRISPNDRRGSRADAFAHLSAETVLSVLVAPMARQAYKAAEPRSLLKVAEYIAKIVTFRSAHSRTLRRRMLSICQSPNLVSMSPATLVDGHMF